MTPLKKLQRIVFLPKSCRIAGLIACSVILSVVEGYAQITTVCLDDSVVLILKGYKQGSTFWQQSPNGSTWSAASGTSKNDSLLVTASSTLYYRAIVIDGSCIPYYSETVQVIVNPSSPTAMAASDITISGFTANWEPVTSTTGSTTYYLDVARDAAFNLFVAGYNKYELYDSAFNIAGLSCLTPYYYRVSVYGDSCETKSAWSNTITVTTDTCPPPVECTVKSTCNGNITDSRDSKTYKTVQIGTQCWMAENLNVGTYVQGALPQTSGNSNQNTSIEKYCYLDNQTNCTTYGGLYMWDEMMAYGASDASDPGPQGICPTGWHIPTDNEFTCLEKTLGGATIAGGKLKDTIRWNSPNTGASNSSGFSALPGGYRGHRLVRRYWQQRLLVVSYGVRCGRRMEPVPELLLCAGLPEQ